jgi:hypothetical protein
MSTRNLTEAFTCHYNESRLILELFMYNIDIWSYILNYLMRLGEHFRVFYMKFSHPTWKKAIQQGLVHITICDIMMITRHDIFDFSKYKSLESLKLEVPNLTNLESGNNEIMGVRLMFFLNLLCTGGVCQKIKKLHFVGNNLSINYIQSFITCFQSITSLKIERGFIQYFPIHNVKMFINLKKVTFFEVYGILKDFQTYYSMFHRDTCVKDRTNQYSSDTSHKFLERTGYSNFYEKNDICKNAYTNFKGYLINGSKDGYCRLVIRDWKIFYVTYKNNQMLLNNVKIVFLQNDTYLRFNEMENGIYEGEVDGIYFKPNGKGCFKSNTYSFNGLFILGSLWSGCITFKDHSYTGDFEDGATRHGPGIIHLFETKAIVHVEYLHGQLLEKASIYYENGDVYQGIIDKDFKPDGKGCLIKANHDIFEGCFVKSRFLEGKLICSDKKNIYVGNFTNYPKSMKGVHYIAQNITPCKIIF